MHEAALLPGTLLTLEPVVVLAPGPISPRPCSGMLQGAAGPPGSAASPSFRKAFLTRAQLRSPAGQEPVFSRSGSGKGGALFGPVDGSGLAAPMPPPSLETAYVFDSRSDRHSDGGGDGGGCASRVEDFDPHEGRGPSAPLPDVPKPMPLLTSTSMRRSSICSPSTRTSTRTSTDSLSWAPVGPSHGPTGLGAASSSGQGYLLEPGGIAAAPPSPFDRGAVLGSFGSRSLRARSVANGGPGGSGGGAPPNAPPPLRLPFSRMRGGSGTASATGSVAAEDGQEEESDSDEAGQDSRRESLMEAAGFNDGLGPSVPRRGSVLAWTTAAGRELAGNGPAIHSPGAGSPLARVLPTSGTFRRPEDLPAAPSPGSSRSLNIGSSPSPGTPMAGSPFALAPSPSGRLSVGFSRRPEDLPAAPNPAQSRSLAGGSAGSTPGTPASATSSSPRPTTLAMARSVGSSNSGGGRRSTEDAANPPPAPSPPSASWNRVFGAAPATPSSPSLASGRGMPQLLQSPTGGGAGTPRDMSMGLSRRLEDLPAAPNPQNARSLAAGAGSSGGSAGGWSAGGHPATAGLKPRSPGPPEAPQVPSSSQLSLPSPQSHLRRIASNLMVAIRPESASRQRAAVDATQSPGVTASGGVSISNPRPSNASAHVVSVRPAPPGSRPAGSAADGSGGGAAGGAAEYGGRSIGYSRRLQDLPAAPSPSNSRSLAAAAAASGGGGSVRVGGGTPGSAPEGSPRVCGWRESMDGPLTPPSGAPSGGTLGPQGGISRRPDEIPAAPSPGQARSLRQPSALASRSVDVNNPRPQPPEASSRSDKLPTALSGGGAGLRAGGESFRPYMPAAPGSSYQQQQPLHGRVVTGSTEIEPCMDVLEDFDGDL